MIKISLKNLAKYMTANASQQRKILRDQKFPDSEGQVQIIYYKEARESIKEYHKNKHEQNWLFDKADALFSQAHATTGRSKTRLLKNSSAIRTYLKNFGMRDLDILQDHSMDLNFDGIVITVCPDMHVKERGKEKLIKLEFVTDAIDEKMSKIISQLMFETQLREGLNLPSSSILYWDIRRNREYKGARAGARLMSEIEATCQNIKGIWPTLQNRR